MALGSHDRSPTTECDEPVRILSDEVESLAHLWDDIPPAKSLETGSLNSLYPCVPIGTACVRFLAPEHDVKILDAAVFGDLFLHSRIELTNVNQRTGHRSPTVAWWEMVTLNDAFSFF